MQMLRVFTLTVAMALSGNLAFSMDGDADAGAKVFRKCAACHVVDSVQNKVGPHLQNIVGRTPATAEGFKYSKAMIAFGEANVWDDATLRAYLAKPRDIVPGTRMAFAGLRKDQDIADVLAYLKQFSQ